jgi:hypothetical protein
MTDQPSRRPDSQWPGPPSADGTPPVPPAGSEPPRFVPPYGSGNTGAAPSPYQPAYGQDAYSQDAYSQGVYGQDARQGAQFGDQHNPYTQPGSPYAQPSGPYGQRGYYGAPAEPKTLSIASMVCGIASVIMGWLLLPQVAAIVTGHMALRREPTGRGMAIAGLVLGYLCLLGYGVFWLLLIIGIAVSSTSYGY